MPQTVLITLTLAGVDTGPFDLYCVDAFGNVTGPAFEQNISKATLAAGYLSTLVPDGCTKIRIQSDNQICSNYTEVDIINPNSTTTTTSTSSTSTTTTTTVNPSDCKEYTLTYVNNIEGIASFLYTPCDSTNQIPVTITSGFLVVCAVTGSVSLAAGFGTITPGQVCPTTTTTTSTSTTSTSSTTTTTTIQPTTTTTSTSTSTTTSSTTTTSTSTTSSSTTTTTTIVCQEVSIFYDVLVGFANGSYRKCNGEEINFIIGAGEFINDCIIAGSLTTSDPNILVSILGPC